MDNIDFIFYIHRSFSLLLLALLVWLWNQNRKFALGYWQWNYIILVLGLEISMGIILAYFDLPYFAQPLHLLLGSILIALQIHALVKMYLHGDRKIISIS